MIRFSVAALFAVMLAACTSPYAPHGITGGFLEKRLGPNSFRVSFDGNGYTGEEQVVDYWLYRCAELTIENGYSYFGILPEGQPQSLRDDDGPPRAVKVKGGGGSYIYVPSYTTIRTWHKRATIVMYHSRAGAVTPEQAYALHARTVMDKLEAYVKSEGKEPAPSRKEVIDAAMHHSPDPGTGPVQDLPSITVRPGL